MNTSNVLLYTNLFQNVPDIVSDVCNVVPEDNNFKDFVGFKEVNSQKFSGFVNNCS